MIRIQEVIVVEGKYDVARLRAVVDTLILDTAGFGIFKDVEKLSLLRTLAKARGLLVLTDSDSAGFVIRNYLNSVIPSEQIKHAYIPAVEGKEKRKVNPSKEGLLGVEGLDVSLIEQAIRRSGVTVLGETAVPNGAGITKLRLFEDGLSGKTDSAEKRRQFQALCGLPSYLSTNQLLRVINTMMTEEQYRLTLELLSQKA